MTLKQIWESKEDIFVHCNNEEEEKRLLIRLNELNYRRRGGERYDYEEPRILRKYNPYEYHDYHYYVNNGTWCGESEIKFFQERCELKIIEFTEIDDFKKGGK